MNQRLRNTIEITPTERRLLRKARIKIREVHLHSVKELQSMLNVSKIRAMELCALAEFQSLPSIGIHFACDLISMGYYSLHQLKGKDGAKLVDQYEVQIGAWADPCVEDQFRLVVHYASHPNSHRNWWAFTTERKSFREKNGYPASRPKRPWFELPEYQLHNRLAAKNGSIRKDLHGRLKNAVSFMRKNLSENMTLKQMAEVSNLSPYHFLRNFKSAYGKTPFQYLKDLRLKQACKLLRNKEKSVGTVMSECGFENLSSFIRLFKKNLGVTPMGYRTEIGRGSGKAGF